MHRHDGRSFQLFFWIVITKSMCDETASMLFKYVMMGVGVQYIIQVISAINLTCYVSLILHS